MQSHGITRGLVEDGERYNARYDDTYDDEYDDEYDDVDGDSQETEPVPAGRESREPREHHREERQDRSERSELGGGATVSKFPDRRGVAPSAAFATAEPFTERNS